MKVKIYCFEGEWSSDHPELSVRPLTQVLQHTYQAFGSDLDCKYRFCQTINRLEKNLLELDGRAFNNQNSHYCFYFAFHGNSKGLFDSDGSSLSFEDIAKLLGKKAENSIVFFGSCGAKASMESFKRFKVMSGARLVVGYSTSVDWIASSTFEMLFFSELRGRERIGPFMQRIQDLAASDQTFFSKLKVVIAQ